jgi:hypothetical protein
MIVTAKLENPDQTDVTLTITMPLVGWRAVHKGLFDNPAYVCDQLRDAIRHVIVGLEAKIEDKSLTREVEQ